MITKIFGFFLSLFALFLSLLLLDFYLRRYYFTVKTFPNIVLDKKRLSKKGKLKVVYLDGEKVFSKENLGIKFNEKLFLRKKQKLISDIRKFPLRLALYLGFLKVKITPELTYDRKPLSDFLESLSYKYDFPATDAKFVFENGKVKEFVKEKPGRRVNKEKFFSEIDPLIKNWYDNKDLKIKVSIEEVEPKVKLSDINSFGIEELIGFGKSSYKGSIWQREHNIILSVQRIDGNIVPKGEVFSFNKALGEVSVATGYKQSYIIKNGRTVLGDGGGVCQVSTTLFRAVLNAGLPIVERKAHSYRVGYYEQDSKPGFDATVFSPSVDFKFKNDTPAYVLIQGKVNRKSKEVYFFLYGKKDGRKVFISKPRIYDVVPPPEPLYVEDPTLPAGVVKQIDFAAWGAKSVFTYRVERNGKILFKKVFKSVYRPWQAVYLVGKN